MRRRSGFTLIELLVVIAIIAILAAIAVPNVRNYILRANVARAVSDINGIDTSLTGILSDVGRHDFRSVLSPNLFQAADNALKQNFANGQTAAINAAAEVYSNAFYNLLRQGRDADATYFKNDQIRLKLGTAYQDLGQDPWKQKYLFYVGPIPKVTYVNGNPVQMNMPFRCYRLVPGQPEKDNLRNPLVYDATARQDLEKDLPGNPPADDGYGIPADRNLPVYVWSRGQDAITNQGYYSPSSGQFEEWYGGGDDINNWDKGQGWRSWY